MIGNYLITGATSGLGEYVARFLADRGDNVILLGRNKEKLEELSHELGERAKSFVVDLEVPEQIGKVFENISVKMDGLIHCAGLNEGFLIKTSEPEMARRVMNVNSFSFLELGKHFCKKKYSQDGASIVVISSMASKSHPAGMSLYSASKAALNSFVKTMAKENVKRRLRVNAVLPGYLEKTMKDEVIPWQVSDTEGELLKDIQPLGRIPYEQVCMLVDFLLSERSQYVTGSLIEVSGGQ
ncbi:MAG: SDR family oxidoreductase [Lachnospiraceae bacterium]|nr:SDR family oxidoreductase [Lachnospiraceae bacterium]